MKVTVYHVRKWDLHSDGYVRSKRKCTAESAKKIDGVQIMVETAEEVEASALDEHGRYDPTSIQSHAATICR
jgi:hypothetical protein